MHILVNAVPLTRILTGLARYLRCLYTELSKARDVTVSYFTVNGVRPDMPLPAPAATWARHSTLASRLPTPLLCLLRALYWERHDRLLRKTIRHGHYDLYHETRFIPAAAPGIPMVFTVYDLSLITYRQTHPRDRLWLFDRYFSSRIGQAEHILTISDYIKQEILTAFSILPHKITTTPLAAEAHFRPSSTRDADRVRRDHGLPDRFFLFVGSLEPRKNVAMLIQAMAATSNDIPLVLVGWRGWGDKGWEQEIRRLGLQDRIIFAGHVDDQNLPALYSGALALVYPSLYEGFGLPVAEAMACGCPVISSNAACLPEVAGNAALLVDPHDAAGFARAMDMLAEDSVVRVDLARRGLERTNFFTWQRTAEATLRVFREHAR